MDSWTRRKQVLSVLQTTWRNLIAGSEHGLGGNAPEDHGCGLLNSFQALAQQVGVSVPKLDVIGGSTASLKPDGLADDESHSFGLGLADLLGGQGAALSPVQHLVADLVRQSREFLGRLHPRKQGDLPAVG